MQEINGRLRKIEGATIKHAHRFLIRRWKNLQEVRRHATSWFLFVLILSGVVLWQTAQGMSLYSINIPSEGGTYTEGVFGALDNLNPIFASTQAERSASRLLFAHLMQYDDKGDLVGELASGWQSDAQGKVYTVGLRKDARWTDGVPITATDVVYTFNAIKDADTKSPLYSGWRNILVSRIDDYTVVFTLPTPYAPFLNALTIGLLPEHILGKIPLTELRNNGFNRAPSVTSGPFVFQDIRALDDKHTHFLVRLAANADYFAGAPKLSRFQLNTYADPDQLLNSYRSQEVAAVSDLNTEQLAQLGHTHSPVRTESPLYNAVYAFFKIDSPMVQDPKVRQALELATDRSKVIAKLNNRVQPVTGPLLPGQLGYNPDLHQPDTNLQQAEQLLDAAGWHLDKQGQRINKDGQHLKLQLAAVNTGDYPIVAQELMRQWSKLGISFESQLIRPEDIQQNVIVPRAYDVLVYEIALGSDPDVYAYWDSTQANAQGFNLSNYKSAIVDDTLDTARSRSDAALRSAKYHTFTQQWLTDVPAVGLYRPSMSYVQTPDITSFTPRPLVDQTDRYFNVRYWSASKDSMRPTL